MVRNKILFYLLLVVFMLSIALFIACSTGDKNANKSVDTGDLTYDTEFLSAKADVSYGYNNNLFYVNNLEFQVADPSVIYITEGKDAGWFYAYGTSDDIGGHGFQSWRSKDLSHWESMGVAMSPEKWAINCYWAPEVIYDNGLYYLFYSAFNLHDRNRPWMSVAVSETPDGPFVQPQGVRNYYGKVVGDPNSPMFDFTLSNPALVTVQENYNAANPSSSFRYVKECCIDASPFIDPVTKEKYLYFSYYNNYGEGSFVYGVKMLDWYTPDYSTLTCLTYPGYNNVANGLVQAFGDDVRLKEGGVNEGPFMVYHEGKYYLTLSVFGYTDSNYQVKQAVSDAPLGVFEKIPADDGGKVISSDVANWGHIVSAGHHSFINIGNETFIAYHTFKNRNDISGGRALAVDRVVWIKNSEGLDVMYTNGPSWSVQPLPENISGYKNIAESATVTASNTAEYSDSALLTDGLIKYQEFDLVEEYEAKSGKSQIELSWSDYKTVRAIMIYNSYDYEKTFAQVNSVQMEYLTADGKSQVVEIKNLPFDWDWHFESDYEFMRPGGAAIAEFDELPVRKITITIDTPEGASALAIGEIVVLGKDSATKGVTAFSQYEYSVTYYASSLIIRDSANFGTIENTNLATEYGYDLTHDDGTENAFITQNAPGDMSCYFKNVYSTSFYEEAYFTVTSDAAFGFGNYVADPYPKFGLAISCDDDMQNTIFFYVDAAGFSNKALGVAQRMLDNSDWDWNSTEQVVSVSNMNYLSGNYVKLAVLRQGEQFYFLYNDEVVIQYSSFNVFGARQKAGVGFRSFSTPLSIKGYYASADEAVVAEKARLYTAKLNGENLGNVSGFVMTSGWDLTYDRGENPVAVQTLAGDQYAYFKGINSTEYYAEIQLSVTKDLGDPYPKFGLASRIDGNTFFFFIDGSSGYQSENVGYVWRKSDNSNWDWANSVQSPVVQGISYSDGEYVTLGMLRQGSTFKLYVNGTLQFTVENVENFTDETPSVVSILSFTTGITIKDYFATTDENVFP